MINYCAQCGSNQIITHIPAHDTHKRQSCQKCHTIFYCNPKVVIGAVTTYQNKYLLCKRAIEPRIGYWTYPAGFLENNETVEEGTIREAYEEAEIKIELIRLIGTYSLTTINQVHLVYSAQMLTPHYATTHESSEVRLTSKDEIPWHELAFPVTKWGLQAHLNSAQNMLIDSKSTHKLISKT